MIGSVIAAVSAKICASKHDRLHLLKRLNPSRPFYTFSVLGPKVYPSLNTYLSGDD